MRGINEKVREVFLYFGFVFYANKVMKSTLILYRKRLCYKEDHIIKFYKKKVWFSLILQQLNKFSIFLLFSCHLGISFI